MPSERSLNADLIEVSGGIYRNGSCAIRGDFNVGRSLFSRLLIKNLHTSPLCIGFLDSRVQPFSPVRMRPLSVRKKRHYSRQRRVTP
jgi:hypothetical protein